MFKSATYLVRYWFNLIVIQILLRNKKDEKILVTEIGNPGAMWKVPTSLINKRSICYCAGVGEDISFEKGLFQLSQSSFFFFDPTPRSIEFMRKQKLSSKIHFKPWGLWSKNSKQKFFAPKTQSFVSHSIVNLHKTKDYFIADCKSLDAIMKYYGHKKLDLLKIDIEGAEYMVLYQLLSTSLRPSIIAVEFDQPMPVKKTYNMILNLIHAEYTLINQTGWNFIFLYSPKRIK